MGSTTATLNSILPILQTASQVATAAGKTISTVKGFAQDQQAIDQLRDRQKLDEAQTAQTAAFNRQEIETKAQQDEEIRRDALRRAVARQRASFGASGVTSGNGGSTEAVLLGLTNETEDELRRRTELDNLRSRAIDLGAAQQVSQNVLQATQLAEKNDVNNLFRIIGD